VWKCRRIIIKSAKNVKGKVGPPLEKEISLLSLFFVLFLSSLLEGVIRKLVALVHSRIGPPDYQSYLDIFKLLGKEEIVNSPNFMFRYSAVLSFAVIMLPAVLIPIAAPPPMQSVGEIIVSIYIITLSAIIVMMSSISSTHPFGIVGGWPEFEPDLPMIGEAS